MAPTLRPPRAGRPDTASQERGFMNRVYLSVAEGGKLGRDRTIRLSEREYEALKKLKEAATRVLRFFERLDEEEED